MSDVSHQISVEERERVRPFGTELRFERGQVIFERGDVGETMFVILDGEVELIFGEGVPAKLLEDGDYFGELAILTGEHHRTATAVSRSDTDALALDSSSLDRLEAADPKLYAALMRRSCAYLLASEQRLVHRLETQNRELLQTLDYLRRTREELDRQELLSRTDDLTGLYNRRCFDDQLQRFAARARETGCGLAALAIDLDGFKEGNDRHGHAFGDGILRDVGGLIREAVRARDLPCRVGGDEFGVLLFDIDAAEAHHVAERIRDLVAGRSYLPPPPGVRVPITVSIGGTRFSQAETANQFWERADQALYAAKHGGRNRVEWRADE